MHLVVVGAPEGLPTGVRRASAEVDSVVDAIRALPPGDEVVLTSRQPDSRRVARSVRLALGSERLAHLHLDVPLTAWGVAVSALALPGVPAHAARAIADSVLSQTITRALLSSVASLESPMPTFRQHMGSLLPDVAFVVDPQGGTVGRYRGELGLDLAAPGLVVVARSERPVIPEVDAMVPPEHVALTGLDPGWNAPRWFEASVLKAQIGWLVAGTMSTSSGWTACDTCRRPAPSPLCIFCDIPTPVSSPALSQGVQG